MRRGEPFLDMGLKLPTLRLKGLVAPILLEEIAEAFEECWLAGSGSYLETKPLTWQHATTMIYSKG